MPALLIAVVVVVVVGVGVALTVPAMVGQDSDRAPVEERAPVDSTHQAPQLPPGYELEPVDGGRPYVDPYTSYPTVDEMRDAPRDGDDPQAAPITPESLFGTDPNQPETTGDAHPVNETLPPVRLGEDPNQPESRGGLQAGDDGIGAPPLRAHDPNQPETTRDAHSPGGTLEPPLGGPGPNEPETTLDAHPEDEALPAPSGNAEGASGRLGNLGG